MAPLVAPFMDEPRSAHAPMNGHGCEACPQITAHAVVEPHPTPESARNG